MPYEDLETSLRSIVDNEFTKRDSDLDENIEKTFSVLAAKGLLSSGVAVTEVRDLSINDLKERLNFISDRIQILIDSKKYSYESKLQQKAENLFRNLSESAKNNCSKVLNEAVGKINKGSIQECLKRMDQEYKTDQNKYLSEMDIFFDDIKSKYGTKWSWYLKNSKKAFWFIVGVAVGTIITFFLTSKLEDWFK